MIGGLGLAAAERGFCPTPLIRLGIRQLLAKRLDEQRGAAPRADLIEMLKASPIALSPHAPNEQHYELPAEFFENVLGPHLKYSSAFWPAGTESLADAETRMLELTCERAQIEDGQKILELGCGWGSLSLYMAARFPQSRIVAVSNSATQREFIEQRRPTNLTVVTADMNTFDAAGQFDRVVSIEMFEHMRNYARLLRRIRGWLTDEGRLFVHIFCHGTYAYPFETTAKDDWMGQHFFTAGIMPSFDLLTSFRDDFAAEAEWSVNGMHYQRTAAAWRENLEENKSAVHETLRQVYGADEHRWYHRWRLFFLACEELFGYRNGTEWMVAHYRFAPQKTRITARTVGRAAASLRGHNP